MHGREVTLQKFFCCSNFLSSSVWCFNCCPTTRVPLVGCLTCLGMKMWHFQLVTGSYVAHIPFTTHPFHFHDFSASLNPIMLLPHSLLIFPRFLCKVGAITCSCRWMVVLGKESRENAPNNAQTKSNFCKTKFCCTSFSLLGLALSSCAAVSMSQYHTFKVFRQIRWPWKLSRGCPKH